MFELEQEVSAWRQQMHRAGINEAEILEELAAHLRDETVRLILSGMADETAFRQAVSQLGSAEAMRREFEKRRRDERRPITVIASIWAVAMIVMLVWMGVRLFIDPMNPLLLANLFSTTAGYTAALVAGSFGIGYACWHWVGRLSPRRAQSLAQAASQFTLIAAGFVVVALITGIAWNSRLFGQYLRRSPRETGSLFVLGYLLVAALGFQFRKLTLRQRMVIALGGNLVVWGAWFGAGLMNPVNVGWLRNWPFEIALAIPLVCLLLVTLPAKPARWQNA